ncbi:MAG TPA: alanine racemase [Bacteroidetes bacterium]|nr:alanine racemase [Bacteroidota bacterium]HEX04127.1 alanine racemase [Bacteroidota bacterium]
MKENDIQRPTLIINEEQARANIKRMADKARNAGVRFRPHFKTHQSALVGQWFKDQGVSSITVSSYSMAAYFADHGWNDITIAFPINLRELDAIQELASRIELGVLVDSSATVSALEKQISRPMRVWLKIDTGYGRSGVHWDQTEQIIQLARQLNEVSHLTFRGLLTHAGHSYHVRGSEAIQAVYRESTQRLQSVRTVLLDEGFRTVELSTGDTPCCSVVYDFADVDEIRPGNFVYYDLMQTQIGSCSDGQVAVTVACPVVGIHPDRSEIIIYGGGVHLSKDSVELEGHRVYGCLAEMDGNAIITIRRDAPVTGLSQEHGVIHVPSDILNSLQVGDLVYIVPAHSCMAVNCLRR